MAVLHCLGMGDCHGTSIIKHDLILDSQTSVRPCMAFCIITAVLSVCSSFTKENFAKENLTPFDQVCVLCWVWRRQVCIQASFSTYHGTSCQFKKHLPYLALAAGTSVLSLARVLPLSLLPLRLQVPLVSRKNT